MRQIVAPSQYEKDGMLVGTHLYEPFTRNYLVKYLFKTYC